MIKTFDDFTYKLTRLMPNNKMAPKNALWLSVKTEKGFQSGMLVRIHIQKQVSNGKTSSVEIPEFIQQIEKEQKEFMKPWNRFIRFIKKLFTKKYKK